MGDPLLARGAGRDPARRVRPAREPDRRARIRAAGDGPSRERVELAPARRDLLRPPDEGRPGASPPLRRAGLSPRATLAPGTSANTRRSPNADTLANLTWTREVPCRRS